MWLVGSRSVSLTRLENVYVGNIISKFMLSSISVRNLGGFDNQNYEIDFKGLNIIVGTNNSGKSTLFKGLNLIRDLTFTRSSLRWNTSYYRLENFKESVYGHDITKLITIECGYDNKPPYPGSRLILHQSGSMEGYYLHGNNPIDDLGSSDHRSMMNKIWYFSPNINPISFRDGVSSSGDALQPLLPSGADIKQFLVERWTDQDPNWQLAQDWFKKIDPQLTVLKTPLYGNQVSLETERNDGNNTTSINLSLQGSGIQNLATIISGIIFSPKGATIIIEEPENYLNSRSVEILVDLFNFAVNELDKQIIIVTHSWEIINAYCSDIGTGTPRGSNHVKADPNNFKLTVIHEKIGLDKIQDYDLSGKKYTDVRKHFKDLWG